MSLGKALGKAKGQEGISAETFRPGRERRVGGKLFVNFSNLTKKDLIFLARKRWIFSCKCFTAQRETLTVGYGQEVFYDALKIFDC